MAWAMSKFSEIYAARMRDGSLIPDAAQQAVLPEFDRILQGLAAPPQRAGLFGRRKKPAPVKGLYLWGGVGRGKSMLMDLFVAAADVPSRRVHFHAFMQEIHAGMNAARAQGVDDALSPVAEEIAGSVRLLAFDEMQITDITDAMIVGRLFEKLFADDVVVARHERLSDAGGTRYDWQHYIPLVQRKPGALRNGAPFADMPPALQQLRRALLRQDGGDRVMAQVLAIVPRAGLDAVVVAAELVMESRLPSGRVSVEHVVNVIGRLNAPATPVSAETGLQISTPPLANTARYDSLRGQEVGHA